MPARAVPFRACGVLAKQAIQFRREFIFTKLAHGDLSESREIVCGKRSLSHVKNAAHMPVDQRHDGVPRYHRPSL
jgi:hypothetical protein